MAQNKLINLLIKFRQKKNNPGTFSFEKAKTIGIIYQSENAVEYKLVNQYIEKLSKEGKEVYSLEFWPKSKADISVLKEKNHYFFKESDLNFFKLPSTKITEKFCATSYDLLINMASDDNIYLQYMIAITQANFKTGLRTDKYKYLYDFLLNPGAKSTFSERINNFDKYLRAIKKS